MVSYLITLLYLVLCIRLFFSFFDIPNTYWKKKVLIKMLLKVIEKSNRTRITITIYKYVQLRSKL